MISECSLIDETTLYSTSDYYRQEILFAYRKNWGQKSGGFLVLDFFIFELWVYLSVQKSQELKSVHIS